MNARAKLLASLLVCGAFAMLATPPGAVRPLVANDPASLVAAAPAQAAAMAGGGAVWAHLGWGGGEGVRVGHINIAPHLPGWGTRYR